MNFSQIIILIIVIVISIIAVRISFKFDLNKYLENRRKIKLDQLKNICPHGRITKVDDNCSQCNVVVGKEHANRINEGCIKNPNLVFKKQKEFIKRAKKLKIF